MGSVVITGASGFIGSRMAEGFLRQGWVVTGVDQLAPAGHLLHARGFGFHHLVLPSREFRELLSGLRPTVVIHAAGPSSVSQSMQSPMDDYQASSVLTMQLLEDVRLGASEAKVVFFSSAAVYGSQESLPISENALLVPLSPYGFHKAMGELAVREYATVFGLSACSVRVFSAYGPGLSRQVMWDICGMALADGDVTLHGTGGESRDFIHGRDIAAGVSLIAKHAPMRGEVFNLASGVETTIAELADGLVHALGIDARVRFTGVSRPGDPERWQADISRLAGLGFAPLVDIRQGIQEYAGWFRKTPGRDARG